MIAEPTEREQRLLEIEAQLQRCNQSGEDNYFEIASLLYEVRENQLYGARADDFKGWIMEITLPTASGDRYPWACRAADIHKFFAIQRGIPTAELAKIGRAKLTRLIPLARKHELPFELWYMAQNSEVTDRDIQSAIKSLRGQENATKSISKGMREVCCPHCGNTFLIKR